MDADRLQIVEEEIDIQHYLSLLRRSYKAILSVVVIATSLAAIYAFKLPNIYRAETQMLIQREMEPTQYVEMRAMDTLNDQVYYNTQMEILRSYNFLEKVIVDNKLTDLLAEYAHIRFPPNMPEEQKNKALTGILQGGLGVVRLKDTRIFTVSFTSRNPIVCKEVSDAISKTYVKQHVEEKLYLPKELMQFFPDDAQKIESGTPYSQLKGMSQEDFAKTLPSVANDPLIKQLNAKAAETDAELNRLRQKFKEKHPKVIEAKTTVKFIQDRVKIETDNIIRNLKTTLASQLQISTVRILKAADVPRGPIGPDRKKSILMALFASLIVSCGVVFGIDFLDDTIKSQDDIEKYVQLPFLGHIPVIKEKLKDIHQKAFIVHYNPLSEISEAFRLVKVAINFSGAPGTLKCLIMTSSVPAEGKSMTLTNLAASFLRDGEKVLIADADLRHPTLHLYSNTDNVKGFSNYLTSNVPFEEVIQKTVIPNLDVIVAGPLSPNPTELFSSYRMENFLREAKEKYDRILIDAPPVTGLADSLVIGQKCDGVIFLVEARKVSRNLVKKAKQRLLETGLKVLGVITNKVDLERDVPSYRYYSQTYYRYYGKKADAETPKEGKKDDTSSSAG